MFKTYWSIHCDAQLARALGDHSLDGDEAETRRAYLLFEQEGRVSGLNEVEAARVIVESLTTN